MMVTGKIHKNAEICHIPFARILEVAMIPAGTLLSSRVSVTFPELCLLEDKSLIEVCLTENT